jgi:hypothetical protein
MMGSITRGGRRFVAIRSDTVAAGDIVHGLAQVRYDVMDADAPDPRLGGHHGVSDRS